ncbi:potassium voltage-gated channel subfamily A member 2-like [Actinia tenebrosa]|uniref:Potassium voltage-gated channel subfamily A member 2-like n=1 Tax=Actinia tenebrosa TaxID=6105 RepID=A0A6P8IG04_ACTTE|nr:potassium voltage-gated channel subfamily A member 2-like [Actinia tenebrosa]
MFKGISVSTPSHFRKQHYITNRELTYSRRIPAYKSPRIILNVSGMRYETYEETLSNYPDTLLGSPLKRKEYYNSTTDEYYLQRDKYSFNAILFFYQSRGILSKPDDISDKTFEKELEFYGIEKSRYDSYSSIEEETEKQKDIEQLPENPIKRKLWLCFEYPRSSTVARILAFWSIIIICGSTVSFCIETLPPLKIQKEFSVTEYVTTVKNVTIQVASRAFLPLISPQSTRNITVTKNVTTSSHRVYKADLIDYWFIIEAFCVSWFTVEYLVRIYSAPSLRRFLISPMGILDIIAILPFYITLAVKDTTFEVQSFTVLRALRLFRVLRIFKLSRYSSALGLLVKTLSSSSEQLKSLCFCAFIGMLLFSSAIYFAENNKTTYPSIPHSFWWTIITMTSVGYGDVVPTTLAGKLVGSFCAMSGIILFCLPTPVLVSNFVKFYLDYGSMDERKKQFAENLKAIFLRNAKG